MSTASRGIDRLEATFDHDGIVPNAGLIVPATLMSRLGLEELINKSVKTGSSRPGRKILTLVAAMIAGATHIDHVDMLRAGATQRVLPFRVMAPSTIGTFLRTFTFGHVRQLDAVASRVLKRVWATGIGPGTDRLVVDLDSTICEVHGKQKQAAGYGYTHVLGYHPLLATRAGTGEVLFARMRKGSANTARGVDRFVDELTANLKRAGATGPLTVRADSGFWSWKLIDRLNAHGAAWSITVRLHAKMKETIEAIDETAWVDIDYTLGGKAQVAEAIYTVGTGKKQRTVRLVVRRTRLTDKAQRRLWPDWRHHAFITSDHDISAIEADRFHREHAVVELAIRDLKEGAGLEHIPSGNYHANSAWLACSVLAHNLGIWADLIGGIPRRTHRSRRTQLVSLPAVIVNRSAGCYCGFRRNGHGNNHSTPSSTRSENSQHHQADPVTRDLTHPNRPRVDNPNRTRNACFNASRLGRSLTQLLNPQLPTDQPLPRTGSVDSGLDSEVSIGNLSSRTDRGKRC